MKVVYFNIARYPISRLLGIPLREVRASNIKLKFKVTLQPFTFRAPRLGRRVTPVRFLDAVVPVKSDTYLVA